MAHAMSYPLDDKVLVHVRHSVCTLSDGRRVGPHGRYGSLHVILREDAARLVEIGWASLHGSGGRKMGQMLTRPTSFAMARE